MNCLSLLSVASGSDYISLYAVLKMKFGLLTCGKGEGLYVDDTADHTWWVRLRVV